MRGDGRAALVVVVVLAATVLGGCTDDADPVATASPTASSVSPSATASPSASASPSATASGPAIPAAARAQTPAGAEAFVRFYIAQSAKAWMVPDPTLLDGLATSHCVTCANLRVTAKELQDEHRKYDAVPIVVSSVQRLSGTNARYVFDLRLRQPAVNVLNKDGTVVDRQSADSLTRAARVVWVEGQWQVDGISE
ncbi:DUF6318 family protein [Phycicoccus duodecadis]|uniref:DUF6318 family protein n=1 Tax=Phycicoccus duodecadis TaxID=173053 RepID=UPI000C709B4C